MTWVVPDVPHDQLVGMTERWFEQGFAVRQLAPQWTDTNGYTRIWTVLLWKMPF